MIDIKIPKTKSLWPYFTVRTVWRPDNDNSPARRDETLPEDGDDGSMEGGLLTFY